MKKLILSAVCLLALTMTACSNKKSEHVKLLSKTEVNAQEIIDNKSLPADDKAEKLALAAEQLMTPGGFFYADEVLTQALAIDSNNKRAQFLKALLKPLMTTKGLHARIQPMAAKDAEWAKEHKKAEEAYESGIKNFLVEGPADLDSEAKVQAHLDQMIATWDELRLFMKNNKDLTLTLNIPEQFWQQRIDTRGATCKVDKENGELIFVKSCDTDLEALNVKVERADIEAIQHMAAAYQVLTIIHNSYDLTNAVELSLKYKDKKVSDETLLKEAKASGKLGQLRSEQQLSKLRQLGNDALAGVRWALANQEKLCPEVNEVAMDDSGYPSYWAFTDIRRKGYMIEEGVCLSDVDSDGNPTERILKKIELALAGNVMDVTVETFDYNKYQVQEIKTLVRYSALIDNPVADLKLLPKEFNDCGYVKSLSDDTVNGLFVGGDATSFLTRAGNLNKYEGQCAVAEPAQ